MRLLNHTCLSVCTVTAFALLAADNNVDAFGAAGPAVGNSVAKASPRPSVPKRIVILPDIRSHVYEPDLWHYFLKEKLLKENIEASVKDMPDPYSFNTKRYERYWLSVMHDDLDLCPETFVVAHGTSADALLRYAERYQIWGALLVCPGGELYHAAERHGRAYVWYLIRNNCPWIAIIHGKGDPVMGDDEARILKDVLVVPSTLYREVEGGEDRFRHRTGPLTEVEQLVAYALTPPVQHPKEDS